MASTVTVNQNSNRALTVRTIVSFVARFGLAAVWFVSGYKKLIDPVTTKQSVAAYELFNTDLVNLIGTALPPIEIALGVMLLAGVFLRLTSGISAVIFIVFIAGIISAWVRGLTIDCGCFGNGGYNSQANWWTYLSELLRDLLFIAAAIWTIRWPFKKWAFYV